jgi:hypothetical protein
MVVLQFLTFSSRIYKINNEVICQMGQSLLKYPKKGNDAPIHFNFLFNINAE